jgi:hypothetical protein
VNCGFRDELDGRLLHRHIQRVELIGYLGPKDDPLFQNLDAKDYWNYAFVMATFDYLDDKTRGIHKGRLFVSTKPGGMLSHALAEISESGMHEKTVHRTNCETYTDYVRPSLRWDHTIKCLDLAKSPSVYGQLWWCVKVGACVLDFGIEDESILDIELVPHEEHDEDDPTSCISFRVTDWKVMLKNVFREERALKALMQETEEDEFTYDHLEESLRDMRRQRFRSRLDPNVDGDSTLIWKMDHMAPLWGRYASFTVNIDYDDIERAERNAVRTLKQLRKEASMTVRERDAFDMIVVERGMMHKEMKELDELFKKFQENILALPNLNLERLHIDQELDPNAMTWTKEIVDRERQSLATWKAQRQVSKDLKAQLDLTNAAASLPDDAFDDEDF